MRERLDGPREDRGRDDRDEDRALHAPHVQDDHEEQAEDEDQGRPAIERTRDAELNGCRTRAHNTGVDQADEGHKEAQAERDCGLEGGGDSTEHGLAEAREDQQENEDTFPRNNAHGFAVAQARTEDQGEGNHRVQAEAGGERQRVVRNNAHEDRHDACDQRGARSNTLGGDGSIVGNGVAQDRRVNDQNVSHREEGDDPAADFMTDGRAALGDLEERIK